MIYWSKYRYIVQFSVEKVVEFIGCGQTQRRCTDDDVYIVYTM